MIALARRSRRIFTALLIAGAAACSVSLSRPDVAGHYQTVTESEWSIDLYLEPDGQARIDLSGSTAESMSTNGKSHAGSWMINGDEIVVTYDEREETLIFSKDRPFLEFGCSGSGPGIRGVSKNDGLLASYSLWNVEALKQIADPC